MILLYILLILISILSLNIVSLIILGIGFAVNIKFSPKFGVLFILPSIFIIMLSSDGRLSGDYRSYLRTFEKAIDSLQNAKISSAVEFMSELDEEYGESDFSNIAKVYATEKPEDIKGYINAIENKNSTLYYSTAINYFGRYGTIKELRDCAVDAAERYPNVAEFVKCAGKAEFDLNNIAKAKYYLFRADKLYNSKNGDVQAMLGICAYYEMDTDMAQSYLESARVLGVSAELEDIISKLNME